MRRRLLRCYPATWRRRYGAEYLALLEQKRLTPGTVADIVRGALHAHVQAHRPGHPDGRNLSIPGSPGEPARETRTYRKDRDMKRGRGRFSCSFCGKPKEEARRLIAGPDGVYICNACVALCQEIIAHDEGTPPAAQGAERGRTGERRAPPWWQRLLGGKRQ